MKHFNNDYLKLTVLVFIAMILSGCYTLLNHPSVADSGLETGGDFNRCIDCHNQHFHISEHGPLYPDPWYDYSVVPWWWNQRLSNDETEGVPVRHLYHDREFIVRSKRLGTNTGTMVVPLGQETGTADPVSIDPSREAEDPGERKAVTREESKKQDPVKKERKQRNRVKKDTKNRDTAKEKTKEEKKSKENKEKNETKRKKRHP